VGPVILGAVFHQHGRHAVNLDSISSLWVHDRSQLSCWSPHFWITHARRNTCLTVNLFLGLLVSGSSS
jgi:hypothetical protein